MALISREARCWAVKELARRAGVSKEFFQSWHIEMTPCLTIIHLQPGTAKQIRFRRHAPDCGSRLAGPGFQTVHAEWMMPPPNEIAESAPDLIVPFCKVRERVRQPLFQRVSDDCMECFTDLPASTFYCLCRVEETQGNNRDVHSRFTAKMSVASRDSFLDRPIVDEWGLAFAQALEALMPGFRPANRPLRVKISHDIDEVGYCSRIWPSKLNGERRQIGRFAWMLLPFDARRAIRMTVRELNPFSAVASLGRVVAQEEPNCLGLVNLVAGMALQRGLHSAVYWKASRLGPFDSGYDPRDSRVRTVVHRLQEQGIENGFHAGYRTFDYPDELASEAQLVQEVIGEGPIGGRQHYLRWSPESWADWEDCGLAYDSTVSYADEVGFRAGTCRPYHPWLVGRNRESRLLEIPLIAMDTSLLEYMQVRGDAQLCLVRELVERCRAVGGVFTFVCHNTTLRDPSFVSEYGAMLDIVASAEDFDWKECHRDEWLN